MNLFNIVLYLLNNMYYYIFIKYYIIYFTNIVLKMKLRLMLNVICNKTI